MLTRSHPSACTAADYIAISTVCTTKLQTHSRLSIEISAHLLEPRWRNRASPSPPLIFHPSFGLSVGLGTLSIAGCRRWTGVRDTVKRLLNYSFLSEECRTRSVQEEKRGEDASTLWWEDPFPFRLLLPPAAQALPMKPFCCLCLFLQVLCFFLSDEEFSNVLFG